MMNIVSKLLFVLILQIPQVAHAETWQIESGDKHLPVMEVFTAEGCGLCPAADRWVDNLPQQGITDRNLVVLNFHIDYLDQRKAWVDRFASPVFSERQRQLARLNLFKTIYTPEFFISGELLTSWKTNGIELIKLANEFKPEAKLKMQAELAENSLNMTVQTDVSGVENRLHSKLYLAVIEDNIVNEIKGGDNYGAVFNHQNLVRTWLGPYDLKLSGVTVVNEALQLEKQWKLANVSVVAIVQNLNDGFVLQSLALPLQQ